MTVGKFLVRWIVAFTTLNVLGFVGHGLWLRGDYEALLTTNPGILRPVTDGSAHQPWMLLAFAILAAGMVWIYAKGNTGQPWMGQGIRFGIAVWLVSAVYSYLIYFAVQPWPPVLIGKQMGWDFLAYVVTALLIAVLSKSDGGASKAKTT